MTWFSLSKELKRKERKEGRKKTVKLYQIQNSQECLVSVEKQGEKKKKKKKKSNG